MKEESKSHSPELLPQNKTEAAADTKIIKAINAILEHGGDIQIQRKRDGLAIFEVTKIKRLEIKYR